MLFGGLVWEYEERSVWEVLKLLGRVVNKAIIVVGRRGRWRSVVI
jgi:hypothetical protein